MPTALTTPDAPTTQPNPITDPSVPSSVAIRRAASRGDFYLVLRVSVTTGIVMAQASAWVDVFERALESFVQNDTVGTHVISLLGFTAISTLLLYGMHKLS